MSCAMTVLACPADVGHLPSIARHLRRSANFEFSEAVLVIDTMPSTRYPAGCKAAKTLVRTAEALQREGIIDRFVALGNEPPELLRRHFREPPQNPRDHRGYPLLGWVLGLECSTAEYVFQADPDILIHSKPGFSWIKEAIDLIKADQSVMFVAPRPGPPTRSSELYDQIREAPVVDDAGNFRFKKTFSSRRYVVQRDRFCNLLPLAPRYVSPRRASSLRTWEDHVDWALSRSPFFRVHLSDPRAWALHCPDHGAKWLESLDAIISSVEMGAYPETQAGHYDLILNDWLSFVHL
jgi:hypothetical protein